MATPNLLSAIDGWGRRAPERVAHVSGERRLTYRELSRRSDALAAHLARTVADDGSPVAIVGHKEPEMLIGFIGSLKAAHPYVPLDHSLPRQRIERVVEAAGCKAILTPQTIPALASADAHAPACRLTASDPCYVMFTSGSTGEPKGVIITLECLDEFLAWMLAEHRFEAGETFLNQVAYSFDVSLMDTYTALLTGGTVFSLSADDINDPKRLHQTLGRSAVTTWVSTPSFAGLCLAERSFASPKLPGLRRFLFCGEVLPPEVAAQLLDRFPEVEVWNTYGPTETTVATTSIRIDRDILARYSPLPIGYPMPGTRVVILGEEGAPVDSGARGEIAIAGPNVSPGYLGRPDLTAQAFFELDGVRAYRTGDRGHWRDGLLFCDGRMDDQVKLHGYRVELGDIEANLRCLAAVRDAVVLPVRKRDRIDSLAAFVILSHALPGTDVERGRALREALAKRLPAYMLPRKFIFLEAFPMTPNGKADRRALGARLPG